MDETSKPKLLFFRFTRPGLPAFIRLHLQEQVKCLAQFFDVVVINGASDYRQLCDEHQPDLTVFESGVYVGSRDVANVSAYPEIPRLGFCHCDAYCESRKLFISDMARFGVETFFSISVSLASYTPAIAENLFVWPNFVDPELYRDHALPKLIPTLFTGSHGSHYPWRNRINRIISEHYPSLQCPHSGWGDASATSRMLSGESYARMINAACLAPTCGTIAKEVVRKHFEIPASNTCLVTERTPALEAAGFSDLVNCVFADDADVLEKVEWLFRNRDELERITRAGHDLVHSRHTIRHRDQVFQWYTLHKQLKGNQRVVQPGPFMPMAIVDRSSQTKNGYVISEGLDRALLAKGDEELASGQYDEAETLFRQCLNYHLIPEARLRLAWCCLYKGNSDLALRMLSEPIRMALEKWKSDPDPVEWAYFIVALLCCGKLREATARAKQFEALIHPELECVREAVRVLDGQKWRGTSSDSQLASRYSVHQLPERGMEVWVDNLGKMLRACGQDSLAKLLVGSGIPWEPSSLIEGSQENRSHEATSLPQVASNGAGAASSPVAASGRKVDRVNVTNCRDRVKSWLREAYQSGPMQPLRKYIGQLEGKWGYFLPYQWSAIRYDERVSAIHRLLRGANIKSGLLIGAAAGEGNTEAFLASMGANPNRPRAVCMNFATPRFKKLQRRLAHNASVDCQLISEERGWREDHTRSFDAVLIDGSEIGGKIAYDDTHSPHFIVLDDINGRQTFDLCQTLLADGNYDLLAHNPSHRGGYAIFRNVTIR